MGFGDAPFMPVGIGVRAIPELGQASDLVQGHGLAVRKAMPGGPLPNLIGRAEGQHHGAMLVNVVPRLGRRNGKVHPNVLESDWLSIADRDRERFRFAAVAGVNADFAAHENRRAQSAPHAWRPPAPVLPFDPVDGRRKRKRMDDPRPADVWMKHNAVNIRQGAKDLFDLGWSDFHLSSQLKRVRADTAIDQATNQLVVQAGERTLVRHICQFWQNRPGRGDRRERADLSHG